MNKDNLDVDSMHGDNNEWEGNGPFFFVADFEPDGSVD
jgi:hypothetical protein